MSSDFLYYSDAWKRPSRSPENDWYRFVPKERAANLAFRRSLLDAVREDPAFADELWMACKRDLLFFVNAFLYIKEPRGKQTRVMPWITWPCQDFFLTELS